MIHLRIPLRWISVYGWIGLGLIAVCWPLNWLLPGPRTHFLFFPLWLGFILCVDKLVAIRSQTSLLRRSPAGFWLLFLASIPSWWLFELLNRRLQNWEYIGGDRFTDLEYFLWASVSFSTVVPAVFETAELLGTFYPSTDFTPRAPIIFGSRRLAALAFIGCCMLALLLLWPRIFYPLTWISLIFIFEPICKALHRPCLLDHLERRNWRPLAQLALGALVCGFFWELWNSHSYPKWIYHTPGAEFAYLFEMPALGYLGYLPFGLELYSITHLLLGFKRLDWIEPATLHNSLTSPSRGAS